jgi:ubiquinone/menaquinone biosynthesis C-methylase UbiE
MFSALFSVIKDKSKPYAAVESWGYDKVIAPAVLDFARHKLLTTAVLARAELAGDILEVGCGGGQLLSWLGEQCPRARLTGLDLSAEQVARAKRRVAHHGGRVNIIQGSALELPSEAAKFDVVISVGSIKHWPDMARGMREILRVLRPGGAFYVVEIDRGCKLNDASRFVDAWRVPGPARRVALPLFRTFVAGVAIDLDDARQMLRELGLPESGASRVLDTPAVLLSGVKPGRGDTQH